ncbi:DUF6241 domain-containing protein [Sporosarcina psychrophila]|uniref:DUF6241 domain-containing protein n=1 Tax=Sporosarcina psychrophila TaxID=1476 RepID=UPI00078D79DD|nr:DUF6241 domain-containing protein [Sporosarcina psychrophila]AMQ05897.1 hypothetical protein AZE41_08190 [Sporosarcina psychrophila]
MKYKKTILITSGIVALSLSAYLVFNQWNKGSVTIEEKPSGPKAGVVIPVIEIDEKRTIPVEEEFPTSMEEYGIQEALHGMSHQKVAAEDKWGFLPMTQDRVQRLIEVVEANKYISVPVYLDILNRWANNDFSRADKDHNAIWDLQEGNVGKASGLLSIEEERAFIKKYFKIENE